MTKKPNTSKRGEQLLKRLRGSGPFLAASLVVRNKRCGRPDCRCAKEGPIHPTANVTWKEQGRTRTLHVPRELIEEVAQWVEEWKTVRELVHKISEEQRRHLLKLRKRPRD
jgi:hypothetical protein